jgi:hypothetical protein
VLNESNERLQRAVRVLDFLIDISLMLAKAVVRCFSRNKPRFFCNTSAMTNIDNPFGNLHTLRATGPPQRHSSQYMLWHHNLGSAFIGATYLCTHGAGNEACYTQHSISFSAEQLHGSPQLSKHNSGTRPIPSTGRLTCILNLVAAYILDSLCKTCLTQIDFYWLRS